ncbi:hypothetical protein GCM10010116_12130 [Microbispora rosea subsp. aerata]|nr:hypothetical protein [Microbispora rosea]GGO06141.1 hypothetical protein GCM10010116_12130 [Microbispora rosea subsp. aerata]GIH55179.1 hypothetical protein Mro02_20930 [Microbispora rosea subsp. aerata]GLJ82629.1 hypothetical protein GCM10017588_13540 [Microbispora rosea subsp. aerata]
MSTSDDHDRMALEDLEARLRALGADLGGPVPPPADVARAVRARLEGVEAEPVRDGETERGSARLPRRRRAQRHASWRPSPRLTAAVVAVLAAVLLGATPQGRAAVVSVLRFAGVEIHVGGAGPLPTGVPGPLPGERRVTLEEARRAVRFPIAVPSALGEPADVRLADGGRVVTLLWPGVRLDEFDGTLGVVWHKELGEPWPEQVSAVGGWWIPRPHGVSYVPSGGGEPREERVAGPTLIWQHGLVGLRLEGPDHAEAVRIASSVR